MLYSLELAKEDSNDDSALELTATDHRKKLVEMEKKQSNFILRGPGCAGIRPSWEPVHWIGNINTGIR